VHHVGIFSMVQLLVYSKYRLRYPGSQEAWLCVNGLWMLPRTSFSASCS